jgi:hypothetical protein
MRQVCESCEYFKYVDSKVYGRCQCYKPACDLGGTPRIPCAEICVFFRAKRSDGRGSGVSRDSDQHIACRPRAGSDGTTACCDRTSK